MVRRSLGSTSSDILFRCTTLFRSKFDGIEFRVKRHTNLLILGRQAGPQLGPDPLAQQVDRGDPVGGGLEVPERPAVAGRRPLHGRTDLVDRAAVVAIGGGADQRAVRADLGGTTPAFVETGRAGAPVGRASCGERVWHSGLNSL